MHETLTMGKPQTAPAPLLALGLEPAALETLRDQGFVAPEYRVRNGRRWGPCYKLRWREQGRQRTRYLGSDRQAADEVRAALNRWQQMGRLENEVAGLFRETRRALRSLRELLTPTLEAAGQQWHGYRTRTPRRPVPGT